MKVIENEQIIFFDVDDTLVLWHEIAMPGTAGLVARSATLPVVDPHDGQTIMLTPHEPHIKLLRKHAARGTHVVVWSQGGYAWAEAVIKALGLEDYVHMIMSKPMTYVDDLPVQEWLKDRIYMKPDHPWGKQ